MTEQSEQYGRDFVLVATCETATEAHLLKETLVAAGLSATLENAHYIQANSWMTTATGGVRVMVPAALLDEAKETLAAFREGAFLLDTSGDTQGDAGAAEPDAVDARAKAFTIFRHPTKIPKVVAVKEGFNWFASIFGPLWFISNGMWLTFFLAVGINWATSFAVSAYENSENNSSETLQVLMALVPVLVWACSGLFANFLLCEELKRKGYQAGESVRAKTAGEAIYTAKQT